MSDAPGTGPCGSSPVWAARTSEAFSIVGLHRQRPLTALLPLGTTHVPFEHGGAEGPATALERYRSFGEHRSLARENIFDAEWTGRFYRKAVIVAGPGLGKSTLVAKLYHAYASDGFPVLRVALRSVTAAMKSGAPSEDSVRQWGLDGSGIMPEVAEGLARFAQGHPAARIVVTTRPVGLRHGPFFSVAALRPSIARRGPGCYNFGTRIRAPADDTAMAAQAYEIAKRELAGTAVAEAIITSPQLLGMATSLIVQSGSLLSPGRSSTSA